MVNNTYKVCATSTLVSFLVDRSLSQKCFDFRKSVGCAARRNLIPKLQMRSLQTNKELQNVWIQENIRIINHLSSFLKSPVENVVKFLFNLTLSNYSKALRRKSIRLDSSYAVPLMHNNICESYLTIFDENGNVRDPLSPQSLVELLKVIQIFLNQFLEYKIKQFPKTFFEIIDGEALKKNTNYSCGCDPTGIFRQGKTQNFYSIDGSLHNLKASDLVGFGANIASSSEFFNNRDASYRGRFGSDGVAGQNGIRGRGVPGDTFGIGERGDRQGGQYGYDNGIGPGYGPDGQNSFGTGERGERQGKGVPGYGPDGRDSFGTGGRGDRRGAQFGYDNGVGPGYGSDGLNGFGTHERQGRGVPGYGPDGRVPFGTDGRGDRLGGQYGYDNGKGPGYGPDGQNSFGTGKRGERQGKGVPGYGPDGRDSFGTGGRGDRRGGQFGYDNGVGPGYGPDGLNGFGTHERQGRGVQGYGPDGRVPFGTDGRGDRLCGQYGYDNEIGPGYGPDGQNSFGTGKRGERQGNGVPGYGPDGRDSFGTGKRGDRLGGQFGYDNGVGPGYGPDSQNGFGTHERQGRGVPGYGPDGRVPFGTGGRGDRLGGQNLYDTGKGPGYGTGERGERQRRGYGPDGRNISETGADGTDSFETGERGDSFGSQYSYDGGRGPGKRQDGTVRRGAQNRRVSDYSTDGQNISGGKGRQVSQNLFQINKTGGPDNEDFRNKLRKIESSMPNFKSERNFVRKNKMKHTQNSMEIINVLKYANRGELVTNNDKELIKAMKAINLNRPETEKDSDRQSIQSISNYYEREAGLLQKSGPGTSTEKYNNVSSFISRQSQPSKTNTHRKFSRKYLGEPLPVLVHEPFDEKKPWTWMRRHPHQIRITDKGSIIRGSTIKRYRRDSVEEKYQKAKQRMSIHSTISLGNNNNSDKRRWNTVPENQNKSNKTSKKKNNTYKKISSKYI